MSKNIELHTTHLADKSKITIIYYYSIIIIINIVMVITVNT